MSDEQMLLRLQAENQHLNDRLKQLMVATVVVMRTKLKVREVVLTPEDWAIINDQSVTLNILQAGEIITLYSSLKPKDDLGGNGHGG